MESTVTSGTAKRGSSSSILDRIKMFGNNTKTQDKHKPKPQKKSMKLNKGKEEKLQSILEEQPDSDTLHMDTDNSTTHETPDKIITDQQVVETAPEETSLTVPDEMQPADKNLDEHTNEQSVEIVSKNAEEPSQKGSDNTVPVVQTPLKDHQLLESAKNDSEETTPALQKPDSIVEKSKDVEKQPANNQIQIEQLPNPLKADTNDQALHLTKNTKPAEASAYEGKITAITAKRYKDTQQQRSSKGSLSSLSSCGPSSSSLCHLTELSQPSPETLKQTLMNYRRIYGNEIKKVSNIERHLRGLRDSPRRKSNTADSKPAEKNIKGPKGVNDAVVKQSNSSDSDVCLDDRQAFDKFAENLFAVLERKRADENYEASKLILPVEFSYYRATYDALVQAFGQPYHKCTLELYQQLAAELGLQAEIFVMDKTPNVETNVAA